MGITRYGRDGSVNFHTLQLAPAPAQERRLLTRPSAVPKATWWLTASRRKNRYCTVCNEKLTKTDLWTAHDSCLRPDPRLAAAPAPPSVPAIPDRAPAKKQGRKPTRRR